MTAYTGLLWHHRLEPRLDRAPRKREGVRAYPRSVTTDAAPQPAPKPGIVYFVGRAILRPLLWLVCRPRVRGRANVPKQGPVLLASNHQSAWDTIIIPVSAPRPVQFLTKSALFTGEGLKGKLGRWFFTSIGGVPVVRAAGRDARSALDAGSRILRAGSAFCVFPEGTRSRDGRLHKGHSGAAWMALDTNAQVVPVGLIGTDGMRAFGHLRRGHRRVEVRFGAPVDLSDLAEMPGGRARNEATERIMAAIAQLTGQERSDTVNETSRDSR